MWTPIRTLPLHFQLDTNRINSRGTLPQVNQLEEWSRAGLIWLDLSACAQTEAASGGDRRRRRHALQYTATETLAENPEERARLESIRKVLSPKGLRTARQRADIEIVFNAFKYGAILVTNDGGSKRQPAGILGSKRSLQRLGIMVMSDIEAVAHVRFWIAWRDRTALRFASEMGQAVPDWIGRDG
jgi:hypothetical protein